MKNKGLRIEFNIVLELAIMLLIALKPVVDMFYELRGLDAALLIMALVLAVLLSLRNGVKVDRLDVVPMIWMVVILLSLLVSREETMWNPVIKLLSIFPIYYLGKYVPSDQNKMAQRMIRVTLLIVLGVNALLLLFGRGYQIWAQDANTFSGMYYFKTDLALAMAQVILFILVYRSAKWYHWISCTIAVILMILTNSRIYFAVTILLVCVCGIWFRWKGTKLEFKKVSVFAVVSLLVSVGLITAIAQMPFFRNRHFISFTMQGSIKDILVYNLMFRNIIWADIMQAYLKSGWVHILFGNGCNVNMPWHDAHSLYVATVYNFGIVGIVLLILLLVWAWKLVRDKSEDDLYFLNIGLWLILLTAGISYITMESTQYTWMTAFFMGMTSCMKPYSGLEKKNRGRLSVEV